MDGPKYPPALPPGQGYPSPGQGYPAPGQQQGYPSPPQGHPSPAHGHPQPAQGYPPGQGYPSGPHTPVREALDLSVHWRSLVTGWADRLGHLPRSESAAVIVEFRVPEAEQTVTFRFMRTSGLLVAFMTNGRVLTPDHLAVAAAAANAWNTQQLYPMLSVWDAAGPRPCLAGSCTLPLAARMTRRDFEELASTWAAQARQMFTRCHQTFDL